MSQKIGHSVYQNRTSVVQRTHDIENLKITVMLRKRQKRLGEASIAQAYLHKMKTQECPKSEQPETEASGCPLKRRIMPLHERVSNYHWQTGFPESLFIGGDGRIVGIWIMGNDYRVKSEYFGGYPAGYLRRVKALFPDKQRVLHLFSGRVDTTAMPGDTVDVNSELAPDYVDDAQTLERVPLETYDLVMADPPYSVEDCERYQTTMVKRNKVMAALGARLKSGCHIVWLDQVLPMYRADQFAIEAVIGMVKSTNHRFRVVTVFKRQGRLTANDEPQQPGKP